MIKWKRVGGSKAVKSIVGERHHYRAYVPGKGLYDLYLVIRPPRRKEWPPGLSGSSDYALYHYENRIAKKHRLPENNLQSVKKRAFAWAQDQIFDPLEVLAKAYDNPARQPVETLIPLWRKTRANNYRAYLHVIPTVEAKAFRQALNGDPAHDAPLLRRYRVGTIHVYTSGENCYNPSTGEVAAEVVASNAEKGWGPLLYDFAALVATNVFNMPLVADRYTLSDEAKKLWKFYGDQRWDVDHVDLSSGSWDCEALSGGPPWGIRIPGYVFSEQWGVNASDWINNVAYEQLVFGKAAPARSNPQPLVLLKWAEHKRDKDGGTWQVWRDGTHYWLGVAWSNRKRAGKAYVFANSLGKPARKLGERQPPKEGSKKYKLKVLMAWAESLILDPNEILAGSLKSTKKPKKGKKNPVGGFTTEDIQAFSSYTGKGAPSGSAQSQAKIRAAVKVVEQDIQRSPIFRKPRQRKGEPRDWDLFDYQKAGVGYVMEQYARGQHRAAIFDPMGLGKTNQAVGVVVALGRKALPVVVVAPRSAHQAWRDAFAWLTTLDRPVQGLEMTNPHGVYLIDYGDDLRALRGLEPKDLRKLGVAPKMVIFDEAHEIRNPEAQKTQGAEALMDAARYTLMLTGTPALRSAFDSFALMRLLESRPLRSQAELRQAVRDWETAQGAAKDDLVMQPRGRDYLDVIDPADARRLEKDMRRLAARRSRKAVRDTKAAPDAMLQGLKTRQAQMVPVPKKGAYRDASDEALAGLLTGKKIRYAGQEPGVGIETFETLQNAVAKYEDFLRKLSRNARFDGKITRSVFHKTARDSAAYKNMMRQARQAYLQVPRPSEDAKEQRALRGLMSHTVIPQAVAVQQDTPGDLVFVSQYLGAAEELGKRLSEASPKREIYIYSGSHNGRFINGRYVKERKKRGETESELSARFITMLEDKFATPARKGRTVILTQAAQTGLSLPSADRLVFIDRFYSPGLEDQMEDRINRAGKARRKGAKTEIIYLIPDDIWGYALAHRSANRRASIFALFGEKFGHRKGDVGDDYATPLLLADVNERLAKLEQAAKRRRLTKEEEVTRNVLLNYRFIEHPQHMADQIEEAFWQRAEQGRKEERARQVRAAKERTAPKVLSSAEVAQREKKKAETPLDRFLRQIDADEIVRWTVSGPRGEVSAVQAWDKNWLIMPGGQIISARAWSQADVDEVEHLSELTKEQREVLASAAYKAKPNRGRPRRKPRRRRSRRWRR